MPNKKVYMIVTNDEYETPVICDVVGKQAVADFIGIGLTQFWRCIKADKWVGKYKAIDLGFVNEQDEFEPNTSVVILSDEERKQNIESRKLKKHNESIERIKKNNEEYNRANKERINARSKAYYWSHREERCEYGKRVRRESRMLNAGTQG